MGDFLGGMDARDRVRLRTLLGKSFSLGLGLSLAGPVVYGLMGLEARGRVFGCVEDAVFCPWAIVPGARAYSDGRPSPVLADRLLAARELWLAGKVERILLSGAATAVEGDETLAMRRFLLKEGVLEEALVVDGQGMRTIETMLRARRHFGVESAILCTQAFHLPRSLYLARLAGIESFGLVADRRVYVKRHKDRAREYMARQLAFVDRRLWRRKEPEL